MSSPARDQFGDNDHQPQQETIEIKTLLKMLVDFQAKQTETQAQFLAKQAESQQQIIEILRSSISSSAGNNHKHPELGNDNSRENQLAGEIVDIKESQENIAKYQTQQERSDENIIQSHTMEVLRSINTGTHNTQQAEEEVVRRAEYYAERNDLLWKGDCQKTIEFLRNNPEALKQGVTNKLETVLHAAIYNKREMVLIEEIVKLMSPELLEYKAGRYDMTALHYAALYGNFEAVVLLVNKNPKLRLVLSDTYTPLDFALQSFKIYQRKIVEYLYSVTKDEVPSPFA